MAVLFFRDTDPGAPMLSGEAGRLLEVFESCLIVNKVFVTDGTTFTDRTVAARDFNDPAFGLFPVPSLSSAAYFGMSVQFPQIELVLDTVATGGRFQWEYWGGSWKPLSVVDGTNGLTRAGMVTWTPPGDWATVAVNGVTLYWVRVRPVELPSVYPTCRLASVLRWAIYFSGTNIRAYRMGEGTRFYLQVIDDGMVSTGGAKEAVARGYEDMTGVSTGVRPFPTALQEAKGLFIRKSETTDSTARSWVLVADERTFYFLSRTGAVGVNESGPTSWFSFAFGDIYSFAPSNTYDCMIVGRFTEDNPYEYNLTGTLSDNIYNPGESRRGWYMARPYTGLEGAVQVGATPSLRYTGFLTFGDIPYPNPTDGGIYIQPVWIVEAGSLPALRGVARGYWAWHHYENTLAKPSITFVDGAGELTGRRFALIKRTRTDASFDRSVYVFEVSSTWPKN